jgi:hypothetical protein
MTTCVENVWAAAPSDAAAAFRVLQDTSAQELDALHKQFEAANGVKKGQIPLAMVMTANAPLLFGTLCVLGRGMLRKALKAAPCTDLLVVDEAAQSAEAETLIGLALRPSHCLLVGDVQQLPATVLSHAAVEHHYDWSLMWRLQVRGRPAVVITLRCTVPSFVRAKPSSLPAPPPRDACLDESRTAFPACGADCPGDCRDSCVFARF